MSKILEGISAIIVPLAIFLYFIGWIYLYSLLNYFHIDILSINVPFHFFFIYSFAPIKFYFDQWPLVILYVVAFSLILYFVYKILSIGNKFIKIYLIISVIAVFFFGGFAAASHAGAERAIELRRNPTENMHFVLHKPGEIGSKYFKDTFAAYNDSLSLYKILETRDTYFVFHQRIEGNMSFDRLKPGWVFKVPRKSVALVQNMLRVEDENL